MGWFRQAARKGVQDCTGCSVCLLACPVWQERRDVRFSPQGRARAMPHASGREAIIAAADACTLCGSCEPACPEGIPMMELVLGLRRERPLAGATRAAPPPATAFAPASPVLLPGAALRDDPRRLARVCDLLGAVALADDGHDLAFDAEAGHAPEPARLTRFLGPLRRARRIVAAEGLMVRLLRTWLPAAPVIGLGEALSALPVVRRALRPDDFYVIEARAFHADHARLVGHYDGLQRAIGLEMSLDLQRLAIASTAECAQRALRQPAPDLARRIDWMLQGRRPARVVVESMHDLAPLASAGVPVRHLADLAI